MQTSLNNNNQQASGHSFASNKADASDQIMEFVLHWALQWKCNIYAAKEDIRNNFQREVNIDEVRWPGFVY